MPALMLTPVITSVPSAKVNKYHAMWVLISQASVQLNAYSLVLVIMSTKLDRQTTSLV